MQDILAHSKCIAILGLSPDSTKPSYKAAKYLQENGYTIIPIYPKGGEILGAKVYTNLQDAFRENTIDILNVFRKSDALLEIAKEVLTLENKPKCVWVQLGLENINAKNLLESNNIIYFENLCIKIEHQRLF